MGYQKEKRRLLVPAGVQSGGPGGTVNQAVLYDPTKSGHGLLRVAHMKYRFATDGGAVGEIIPQNSPYLPLGALLVGGIVRVSTAVLAAAGAATIALGTHAGSAANSLLAALSKASWTLNAQLDLIPIHTAATTVHLTAQGQLSLTVATNPLTAGEFEVFVFYVAPEK